MLLNLNMKKYLFPLLLFASSVFANEPYYTNEWVISATPYTNQVGSKQIDRWPAPGGWFQVLHGNIIANVLVVGAGGLGGSGSAGAGGAGGEVKWVQNFTITCDKHYIYVANVISNHSYTEGEGSDTESSFMSISAANGGMGANRAQPSGEFGGCGGGSSTGATQRSWGYGYNNSVKWGGWWYSETPAYTYGGGGGGAGGDGQNTFNHAGGAGGNAVAINIEGFDEYFAAGGGGGSDEAGYGGAGGSSYGGKGGGNTVGSNALAGTAGCGGGGAGGAGFGGGTGTMGIVVIAYTPSSPIAASNPFPAHVAINVETNLTLTWKDGGWASGYEVWFGISNNMSEIAVTDRQECVLSEALTYHTNYQWKIISTNSLGTIESAVWSFSTTNPYPQQAINPSPASGTVDLPTNTVFSWENPSGASEIDKYQVWLAISNESAVLDDYGWVDTPTYAPTNLWWHTDYQWQIYSSNAFGIATSEVWNFRITNMPLHAAKNPFPPVHCFNYNVVPTNTVLLWETGDEWSTNHEVFFSLYDDDELVSVEYTTNTTFTPILNTDSRYKWQIVSSNDSGTITSEVWNFCTIYTNYSPAHYVTPTGMNVHPFTNWANAATNIQYALNMASTGDTIWVGDGVYGEGSSNGFRVYNMWSNTIQSLNGYSNTVIDGGGSLGGVQLQPGGKIIGFTISNCASYAGLNAPEYYGATAFAEHCRITKCTAGGCRSINLYNCVIDRNTSLGHGAGLSMCRAYNCLIIKNQLLAAAQGSAAFGGEFYNSTCISNTGGQSSFYGLTTVKNSIEWDNWNGFQNATFSCGNFETSGEGNITNYPMFADLENGDYRLTNGSYCVGTGTNLDWMTNSLDVRSVDLQGITRILPTNTCIIGRADMGCYEYWTDSEVWTPINLSPANNSSNNYSLTTIQWRGNEWMTNYQVFFGLTNDILEKGFTNGFVYAPTNITENTYYGWKIIAFNEYGAATGDVWVFKTITAPAEGGIMTESGDYIIHTFTNTDTFSVFSGTLNCEILLVAGGGVGGRYGGGGGGGGGHIITNTVVTQGLNNVVVGAGGRWMTGSYRGSNSTFQAFTANGGGYGCSKDEYGAAAANGGCGGGSGYRNSESPPGHGNQGKDGGYWNASFCWVGCGGGGASQDGGSNFISGGISNAGWGGNGFTNSISGSNVIYCGGGGGSIISEDLTSRNAGEGGLGGGGKGGICYGYVTHTNAQDGVDGLGGGGGGGGYNNSGRGGDGVVIIRYRNPTPPQTIIIVGKTVEEDGKIIIRGVIKTVGN